MIEPDHKARLRAMSHDKQQQWELSHSDMMAIRWALAEIDRLEKSLEKSLAKEAGDSRADEPGERAS